MPGSGVTKRANAIACRAARLHAEGHTHREIAEATGLKLQVIAARVKLGERLLSLEPEREGTGGSSLPTPRWVEECRKCGGESSK